MQATCSRSEARENVYERVMSGFAFDKMKKWREVFFFFFFFFKRNNANPNQVRIAFDTQLKITLSIIIIIRLGYVTAIVCCSLGAGIRLRVTVP